MRMCKCDSEFTVVLGVNSNARAVLVPKDNTKNLSAALYYWFLIMTSSFYDLGDRLGSSRPPFQVHLLVGGVFLHCVAPLQKISNSIN